MDCLRGQAAPLLMHPVPGGRRLGQSSGPGCTPAHASFAWKGDVWVAFSLSFLLSKEPCHV